MLHSKIPPLRQVELGPLDVEIERGSDGAIYARSPFALPPYAASVTARLDHWAKQAPERAFLVERDGTGWRKLTFAEAHAYARALGQALLARGLSTQRPLAILSGNSIAHGLFALAALYVGIPYVPISPAYSLMSQDFAKLKRIIGMITPGLVFFEDGTHFALAVEAAVPHPVERLAGDGDFANLLASPPTAEVDAAHAAIGPDTIAKILFTSGSLAEPKGVITTHRMLCANQAMIAHALPFLATEPPVLVDWLPWHHSFGGNHNFGMALHHGGTLYIDHGRPTETGIAETIGLLREVSPTIFFNVPKGYEALVPHLARDRALAENFFRRLKLNFFAGASLPPHLATALDDIAATVCGERIGMISGFGATETAPSVLFQTDLTRRPIDMAHPPVGLPLPGLELKLAPAGNKYEARVKGPNVTPGYWHDADLTRAAFDEEGYYRLGDALRLADETRPQQGFIFDGRLGEDFKLSNGTTVSVGPLRARIMAAGAPYLRDVVIAGENRDRLAALIFLDLPACRALVPELAADAAPDEILRHPAVSEQFRRLIAGLAAVAGGASERIALAALLAAPPSLDSGEITDKGTLNQRAVLEGRAELVEALYRDEDAASGKLRIALGNSLADPFTFHGESRRDFALLLLKRTEN